MASFHTCVVAAEYMGNSKFETEMKKIKESKHVRERGHVTFAQERHARYIRRKRRGMFVSLHCPILHVYINTNYRDFLVHCLRTVYIVALYRNVYCTCIKWHTRQQGGASLTLPSTR